MIISVHRPAWIGMLVVLFWSLAGVVHAAAPLPASPEPHYIRDDAKWLSPAAFTALDAKLEAFERETSSQYVVAVFPKIPEGEELFDFSQRLYESWKPGIAGKDNGAIFLIFADDRKLRIHTGRGMEGVLPDARCRQIISDIVAPELRAGDREAAINAGVDAMIAAAKGEYVGTGRTQLDGQEEESGWGAGIFLIVIIVFLSFGVYFGAFTWGDVIFTVLGATMGGGGGRGGSSGWGGGGGGSSGGGGFSGGGGSSGGGGASGSW